MRYPPGEISGWRLFLQDPLNVAHLSQQILPKGLVWHDWRERRGELFQAVNLEKNMMGLLLGLIITVAAFNIITSLSLLVMEKQSEVAILQTLGLTRRQVMAVFVVQGASSGIIGAFVGALLGILLANYLNQWIPLLGLMADGVVLPVAIQLSQVITIVFFAILLALLSTLYPAWRAASTPPVEALRYE
jgi:lipoprotein-releasing system permease protein